MNTEQTDLEKIKNLTSTKIITEMAAYILKMHGKPMDADKLTCLMYLSEREHYRKYGFPISHDDYWATPFGIKLERLHKLLTRTATPEEQEIWDKQIQTTAIKRDMKYTLQYWKYCWQKEVQKIEKTLRHFLGVNNYGIRTHRYTEK